MNALVFVCCVIAAVHAQVDPNLLAGIFGTPKPGGLDQIIVTPTESTPDFTNKAGEKCICVPYYLCNKDGVAVDMNNVSVTGWGILDVKFGEDDDDKCQESVELCCTHPRPPETRKPTPNPLNLRGCGYSNPNGIGVTIAGGNGMETQFGEFPWVVALLNAENDSYVGVGVLIHPQVVLTVAHYAKRFNPEMLRVRAGEWDTQTVKEIFDYQERIVQDIYIHNDFRSKSLKYDVAMLRLTSPFHLGEHINMICLPDQDESFDDYKNCVSNGWGKDVFGVRGRYAVFLKKVVQDIVPHNRCNTLMQRTRLGHKFRLHSSFLCAGGEEGKDTCQGDGGAPLACPIGDDRHKLAGLVSWGIECGKQDVPAVFASIPAVRDWIDNRMNKWGFGTSTYTIK